MLTGLLFWRALCQPCDVRVKGMAPLEGTSWGAHDLILLPLHLERFLDMLGALYVATSGDHNHSKVSIWSFGLLPLHPPPTPSHPIHPYALLALY